MGFEVPNNVKQMLDKLTDEFENATADQGYGGLGRWPNEPNDTEEIVTVSGMEVDFDADVRYSDGNQKLSTKGFRVQFQYEWSDAEEGNVKCGGVPIYIPYDFSALPERDTPGGKQRTRYRIQRDRLAGCLKGLLGVEHKDVLAALTEAANLFTAADEQDTVVRAKVFFRHRTYTDRNGNEVRTKDADYIRERLS